MPSNRSGPRRRSRKALPRAIALSLAASLLAQPATVAVGAASVTNVSFSISADSALSRIGGVDRYAVSEAVALRAFPGWAGVSQVIIASGVERAMADPLAAAGLCGVYRAPILLVRGDRPGSLPIQTKRALAGIAAANPGVKVKIHVVGGPVTIPTSLMRLLGKQPGMDPIVDRVGGRDRYEVAANIAARMRSVLGSYPATAFIANGATYADFYNALAASALCARNRMPLLLVRATSIPPATASAVTHYSERVVIGSSRSVSSYVQLSLLATRIDGADRYKVAVAVADWAKGRGLTAFQVVAVANRLADSLTGGASVGTQGGPLVYTAASTLPSATATWLTTNRSSVRVCYVLGGEVSVQPSVFDQIEAALGID
jgi:putative cell wall-binding protein